MKTNIVTGFTTDLPTEPGMYILWDGSDTPNYTNTRIVSLTSAHQKGIIDQIGRPISKYPKGEGTKWARIELNP